jgi:uncharacterized membrane protein YphA (DoxX/SURF4 family)
VVSGITLIYVGIAGAREAIPFTIFVLQIVAAGAGILLFTGLWTPIAGALTTIVELWIALSPYSSRSGDPWIPIIEAALGAALAMIGPGAWSIDARLFGRKHIDIS